MKRKKRRLKKINLLIFILGIICFITLSISIFNIIRWKLDSNKIKDEINNIKNITEIKNIIDLLKSYVKTNLDLNDVKDYLPYAVDMNMDNVKVEILPGKDEVVNGVWFFFHDEEKTKEIVEDLFFSKPVEDDDENSINTTENLVS